MSFLLGLWVPRVCFTFTGQSVPSTGLCTYVGLKKGDLFKRIQGFAQFMAITGSPLLPVLKIVLKF